MILLALTVAALGAADQASRLRRRERPPAPPLSSCPRTRVRAESGGMGLCRRARRWRHGVRLRGRGRAATGRATRSGLSRAFDEIAARLRRVLGASWDDVVEISSFHTDLVSQMPAMVAVKRRYVRPPYPAWTAVRVTRLIRFRITEISHSDAGTAGRALNGSTRTEPSGIVASGAELEATVFSRTLDDFPISPAPPRAGIFFCSSPLSARPARWRC